MWVNFTTVTAGLFTPGEVYDCLYCTESDEQTNEQHKYLSGNIDKCVQVCLNTPSGNDVAKIMIVTK